MVSVIASNVRKGNIIEKDGDLFVVLTAENFHPGKGTPTTQIEMRRIRDGVKVNDRYKTTDSLEKAIAAALGRPSTSTVVSTRSITSDGSASSAATSGNPTPAVTPATDMLRSGALSARTLPSARGPSSLTPSLPLSVAPLREVDAADYSALPAFIRGQLPLEQLNSAAAAVHAEALRRCAAGDGASFCMDDVEAVEELPAGKGKVLINALAKLGHVQLKVVYGQGTVYFFAA